MLLPPLSHCTAASQRAPARWYIPGITARPAQPFVPRHHSTSAKLLVFVKMGQQPIVVDLRYSGFGTTDSPFQVGRGSGEYGWSGERYKSAVAYHLLGQLTDHPPRRSPRSTYLVHDRDPAHTSNMFKDYASAANINVALLPAKAPDLDPLDYGVFGLVKRQWEREVMGKGLGWEAQVQAAIRLLREFDPTACIAALPHRMQQCIVADGWHFED